jgi:hypothetical protein
MKCAETLEISLFWALILKMSKLCFQLGTIPSFPNRISFSGWNFGSCMWMWSHVNHHSGLQISLIARPRIFPPLPCIYVLLTFISASPRSYQAISTLAPPALCHNSASSPDLGPVDCWHGLNAKFQVMLHQAHQVQRERCVMIPAFLVDLRIYSTYFQDVWLAPLVFNSFLWHSLCPCDFQLSKSQPISTGDGTSSPPRTLESPKDYWGQPAVLFPDTPALINYPTPRYWRQKPHSPICCFWSHDWQCVW